LHVERYPLSESISACLVCVSEKITAGRAIATIHWCISWRCSVLRDPRCLTRTFTDDDDRGFIRRFHETSFVAVKCWCRELLDFRRARCARRLLAVHARLDGRLRRRRPGFGNRQGIWKLLRSRLGGSRTVWLLRHLALQSLAANVKVAGPNASVARGKVVGFGRAATARYVRYRSIAVALLEFVKRRRKLLPGDF
jgi:hypothetical protein